MKKILEKKTIAFYIVLLAAVTGIVSVIRYTLWASSRDMTDAVIVSGLIIGILADLILFIKDNEYLMIISTAGYSIGLCQMLMSSVGSFVDALQGINMFGDATQVQTIIQMSLIMALSVLASILAGFFKQSKE